MAVFCSKLNVVSKYYYVDHLVFSGYQYVDIGYVPNTNTSIELEFQADNPSKTNLICGSRETSSSRAFVIALLAQDSRELFFNYCKTSKYGSYPNPQERIKVSTNKNVATFTGATATTTITVTAGTFTGMYNLLIGTAHYKNDGIITGERAFSGKIWSPKIYEGSTLLYDLRAAIRTADGAVGYHDVVNDVFHGNSGTGELIAGVI